MQVNAFRPLTSFLKDYDLKPFKMERLGQVVALAGPNGAGKSRVLKLLRSHISGVGDPRFTNYRDCKASVVRYTAAIEQVKALPNDHPDRTNIPAWEESIIRWKKTIQLYESVDTDHDVETIHLVNFVPKSLDLSDAGSFTANQLREQFDTALHLGLDRMHTAGPAYLQYIQNQWVEVTHQNFPGDESERDRIVERYERLKAIVKSLLKSELTRTIEGATALFGKPLAQASLSDGQKVLLQLAVALHAQSENADQLLFLDEPENHLHPAALIEVLDRIRTGLPHIQLWIATHSVPLLAHLYALDPSCIWYVQGGSVAFAGKRTEEVLGSLLGSDVERSRLLQFLELPHQIATLTFATQCLTNPSVAPLRSSDSQVSQIASLLWPEKADSCLRVLDFGAGRGRLLGGLAELDPSIASHIDYVAFDPSSTHKSECEQQIGCVFQTANGRWFNSEDGLFSAREKKSFDVVILCNVLHEIPPDEWLHLFGTSGLIQRSLSDKGYLLIVEDLRIPVGELPNHRGYFLLDTAHLRTLFDISDVDIQAKHFVSQDARQDGRLKAHLISSQLLQRVTAETRKHAIEELGDTAKREMKKVRAEVPASFDAGQRYGLWSQQLANCVLYLDQV